MVLQRWQSVWLLVSAICVALFCFLPVASIAFEEPAAAAGSFTAITPTDNWAVLTVGILVVVLLLVSIFSFRDTRRQKIMTIVSILLMCVLAVCASLMVYNTLAPGVSAEPLGSSLLLLGAIIFAILAYRGIRHDEKLLRAADRLR